MRNYKPKHLFLDEKKDDEFCPSLPITMDKQKPNTKKVKYDDDDIPMTSDFDKDSDSDFTNEVPIDEEDVEINQMFLPTKNTHDKYGRRKIEKASMLRQVWWFIRPSVICAVVLLITLTFFLVYAVVPSGSMENTIMTDSFIIANRRAYDFKPIEAGDIIVFQTDQSTHDLLVKRVIAVGGDKVELKDGDVYINGNKITESYITSKTYPSSFGDSFEVPEDTVLCFGDNRELSADARGWKNPYVPVKDIKGKVFLNFSFKDWYFRTSQSQKYLVED